MGALGGVGSIGVDVGGGVFCSLGLMGDGVGEPSSRNVHS